MSPQIHHEKKIKNGISLITIPVPIVCVFQGCVISSCWYFAQALLRILITACLISLFFERWLSAKIRWRSPPPCFLFRQPSGPGKEFESTTFSVGRSGGQGFRAEKRPAQASAHTLSQTQGGLFWLRLFWMKCTRCERLLLVKHFYLTCLLFSSLENYFGFRTTNVKGKTDHSVSLRWNKRFWTFLKRRVFFLIVHPINLWVDFSGLN